MSGFDAARFAAERAALGLEWGEPLSWHDATDSTNDDAAVAAKRGAPHGAVFGAETQARGRGRRGSEWVSTPGAGLWFSLLLRPRFGAELAPALALCAGLAVRAAVAPRVAAEVLVKWPNDVLAGGRKLAGILVESQLSGAQIASVVIGIGINVAQREFPAPLADIATSLALLAANDLSRERLLADVLSRLEGELSRLEREGMAGVAEALAPHDALFERRLKVDALVGQGAGIDPSGRLRLRLADGSVELIASGHVEVLTA
ncbi:MAG TPA: biotin--[acetyl-CoA-carboxylase] ligase [Polyangiaceae bacterium]|nr:biotin--[acetyl-CoA-carboxylase] ligase [Polyangiaceae bacterium]